MSCSPRGRWPERGHGSAHPYREAVARASYSRSRRRGGADPGGSGLSARAHRLHRPGEPAGGGPSPARAASGVLHHGPCGGHPAGPHGREPDAHRRPVHPRHPGGGAAGEGAAVRPRRPASGHRARHLGRTGRGAAGPDCGLSRQPHLHSGRLRGAGLGDRLHGGRARHGHRNAPGEAAAHAADYRGAAGWARA